MYLTICPYPRVTSFLYKVIALELFSQFWLLPTSTNMCLPISMMAAMVTSMYATMVTAVVWSRSSIGQTHWGTWRHIVPATGWAFLTEWVSTAADKSDGTENAHNESSHYNSDWRCHAQWQKFVEEALVWKKRTALLQYHFEHSVLL